MFLACALTDNTLIITIRRVSYLIGNLPLIQSGITDFVSVNANSYKDIDITFDKPYPSNPNIFASIWGESDSPAYGNINYSCRNVSVNGFTLRIYNDNTSGRSPRYKWTAIL